MRFSTILVLALLSFAALGGVARAQEVDIDDLDEEVEDIEDRAFLLVHRALSEKFPVEGREVTVTIEVYNAGTSSASDVSVQDGDWPVDTFSVAGETAATFPTIPAGSAASLSYRVTPKAAGTHQHRPVVVAYSPDADSPGTRQTTASPWLLVRTLSPLESWKRQALTVGARVTNGAVTTPEGWRYLALAVAAGALALVATRGYLSVSDARKSSLRTSALREFGVEKAE